MRTFIIALILLVSVPAAADEIDIGVFKFSVHLKATHSYEFVEDHKIKSEIGFRAIWGINKVSQDLYLIPRIGYEYGIWNLGPELRIPLGVKDRGLKKGSQLFHQ